MTYSIIRSNGTPLPVVNEGIKDDTTTSISLVGKNYSGYGIVLNENFVHILENFCKPTAPAAPLEGQIWWNSSARNLRVYTGAAWKSMVGSTSAATQPGQPATGDQWFNTNTGQLYIWDGNKWLLVGPVANPGTGLSGAIVEAIIDTANPPQTHIVIKNYIENQVVAIVSKDPTFTPSTPIPGFTSVAPGVTLASTYATVELNTSLTTKQYVNTTVSTAVASIDSVTMAVALG